MHTAALTRFFCLFAALAVSLPSVAAEPEPAKPDAAALEVDEPDLYGTWIALNGTYLRKSDVDGAFDGKTVTGAIGIDHWVQPDVLVGASFSYENSDIATKFNNGTIDSSGHTLSIYGGYVIQPWLVADANIGVGLVEYDFITNGNVRSGTNARRFTAAANLTAMYESGPYGLNGRIGLHSFDETKNDATDNTGRTIRGDTDSQRRLNLSAGASYRLPVTSVLMTVHGNATFSYDFRALNPSATGAFGANAFSTVDPTALDLGVGFSIENQRRDMSVTVQFSTTQLKDNTDRYGLGLSLRMTF